MPLARSSEKVVYMTTLEKTPSEAIASPLPINVPVVAPLIPVSSLTFTSMPLAEPIQRALKEKSYTVPSPIQAQAIPHLLEGRDLIGVAQTGTGKTAAFALPILHRLASSQLRSAPGQPRVLVLTPTRELAVQIAESFASYGKHLRISQTTIFGGVGQFPQVRALKRGVDIVVATPGRLLDLMDQGHVRLDRVEVLVLDEVDRMLDMGFSKDMKLITAKLPVKRQSLLFSATMPREIQDLAAGILQNPVRIDITPVASTAERVTQKVCHVNRADKPKLLLHTLSEFPKGLIIVFSRTKHGANRIAENLEKTGIRTESIHGNKSQAARQRALENFRAAKARVLVATDVAARGLDVKGVSLVVNYDMPEDAESYVHRIGRTARAGAEGTAIAYCDHEERGDLRNIQRLIKQTIDVISDHPFAIETPADRGGHSESGSRPPQRSGFRSSRGGGGGGYRGGQGGGFRGGGRPSANRSR
jgi:ATP-dependent RNA helicase RhlE